MVYGTLCTNETPAPSVPQTRRRTVHLFSSVRSPVLGDPPFRRTLPGVEEKAGRRTTRRVSLEDQAYIHRSNNSLRSNRA